MRIEIDDVARPQVIALLEEHLRNMYELSRPDQVFAFDASKLRAPGISFWTAWKDGTLLGCAALKELSLCSITFFKYPVNAHIRSCSSKPVVTPPSRQRRRCIAA